MRNVIKNRDLSVVILMNFSEPTNEAMVGFDKTLLQLICEATALVSPSINDIGDPFSFNRFSSNG